MHLKERVKTKGFSIIEALLGIFLFVTAFVALYGVLASSLATVAQNKARLGAVALVNEQIEYMRSLPFGSVGVVSGNPSGAILPVESGATVNLNGIQYTRRNVIFWVDDPADGLSTDDPPDSIPTDYKQVKVDVSWNYRGLPYHFFSVTNIAPKGMETDIPGGVFKFTVFNSSGPVQGANIHIYKPGTPIPLYDVDRLTNSTGIWYENGVPPGTDYEITVTKSGYNTARTYAVSAGLDTPDPGHFTSIDNEVNPMSFQIDKVGALNLYFFNTPADETWSDSFLNAAKLATLSSMETSGGNLVLTNTGGVYDTSGYARSEWITPTDFYRWKELSWNAVRPAGTDYLIRLYYNNGGSATLVPDAVLPGNAAGFSDSPIDISGLDNSYSTLRVGVTANTSDTAETPSISDWQVDYLIHSARANFGFNLTGEDTIGTNGGNPVYKLNQAFTANSSGIYSTTTIDSDLYSVTKSGYEFAEICGAPTASLPKVDVAPESALDVYMDATTTRAHSILIGVKNSAGNDIPNALVKIYRASPVFSSYKKTGLRCGQVFWNNLSEGTYPTDPYTLDISAPPYTSTTTITNVNVSGYSYYPATFTGTSLPPPEVSLVADPTSILTGGSSTLTWSGITDATSCTASGSWSGSKDIGGGTQVVSPAVTSTYTLSCTGLGGTTNTSVTVTVIPPPPVITSALTASGNVGSGFSYTITGTNSPTFFSAAPLPAGLSVNSGTGVISGTPTTVGTTNVTIGATNAGGTGTETLVITIDPEVPVITSALIATGVVGNAFSYTLPGSNSPTSFSAAPLPAGLSVNSGTGVISGTPSSAGTTNVTIGATNTGGTGTETLVITINPETPVITSALTASGNVGSGFSYTITGTNSPTSFSAAPLPDGLSVNSETGVISGIPTSAGTTNVTIGATNASGTGTATLVITINANLPLAIDASSPATRKTSGTTITTPSFTPPVGSVLYIAISSQQAVTSITDNRASHLVYTQEATYGNAGGSDSVATLYTAPVTTSQAMTVSITQASGDYVMMKVLVVTGANTSNPVGAIGGGRGATGVVSDTYVSTANNSWGWLIYADRNAGAIPTAGSNQTVYDSYRPSWWFWYYDTYALIKRNSTTPTAGTSVTMNTTAPASGAQTAHLYFEMNPQ
ncbi:MAG: putative Ig domain-containing protein [Candidatus Paceibacterota bacterium]|jgi:hypothetical protein